MKLYGYWRSTSSWRVRIGLGLKGLPYEARPIHLVKGAQHAPGYRLINALGQVPVLELVDEGASHELTQSLAILEYLDERHPEPPFLPRSPLLRARTRELAEIVNSGIQPLQNRAVLERVKALGGDPHEWARQAIEPGLGALEARAAQTAGRFLVGDEITLADIFLAPQLYGARRFGVELARFPRLLAVEQACMERPAFQIAHPDRQPDAETA